MNVCSHGGGKSASFTSSASSLQHRHERLALLPRDGSGANDVGTLRLLLPVGRLVRTSAVPGTSAWLPSLKCATALSSWPSPCRLYGAWMSPHLVALGAGAIRLGLTSAAAKT